MIRTLAVVTVLFSASCEDHGIGGADYECDDWHDQGFVHDGNPESCQIFYDGPRGPHTAWEYGLVSDDVSGRYGEWQDGETCGLAACETEVTVDRFCTYRQDDDPGTQIRGGGIDASGNPVQCWYPGMDGITLTDGPVDQIRGTCAMTENGWAFEPCFPPN